MENKDWREEIRCNNNGCNCTKEERATNNGNCKHSIIVYMEDKSCLKIFSGELRKDIESLVRAVLKSKQEEIKGEIKKKRKIIFPLDTKPEMDLESITHLAEFNKKSMEYNQALDDLKPIISNIFK